MDNDDGASYTEELKLKAQTLCLLLLVSFLCLNLFVLEGSTDIQTGNSFNLQFPQGTALNIQEDSPNKYITLTISTGNLYGTGLLTSNSTDGTFVVLPTTTGIFTPTATGVSAVYVNSVNYTGLPFSFSSGVIFTVTWEWICTLTMESTSGGTVTPSLGSHDYEPFTNVTLIAAASSGYAFTGWELNGVIETTTQSTWFAYLDMNHVAKAHFLLIGTTTSSSLSTSTLTSTSTSTLTSTSTSSITTTSPTSTTTFTSTIITSSTLTSSATSTAIIIGTSNTTFYFRSDAITTNDQTGYWLGTENSNSQQSLVDSTPPATTTYYAFDVYLARYGGTSQLLEEKIGLITAHDVALAEYIGYWNSPDTNLLLGYDAFKVIIYSKIGDGAWTSKATFISSPIISSHLYYQTWMFKIWVNKTSTQSTLLFGNNQYNSRITGVNLKVPTDNEMQSYRWAAGDTISFIFGAYTDKMGSAAYLVILLIPTGSLYMRHKNTSIIVFLFIMFGGTGGLVWFLVPAWAATVVDALLVICYGFLVFKVIR